MWNQQTCISPGSNSERQGNKQQNKYKDLEHTVRGQKETMHYLMLLPEYFLKNKNYVLE